MYSTKHHKRSRTYFFALFAAHMLEVVAGYTAVCYIGASPDSMVASTLSIVFIFLSGLSFCIYHFIVSPDRMKTRSELFLDQRRLRFDGVETETPGYMPCRMGRRQFKIDGFRVSKLPDIAHPGGCDGRQYNEYCAEYYFLLEKEEKKFSSDQQSQLVQNGRDFTNVYGERLYVQKNRSSFNVDGVVTVS